MLAVVSLALALPVAAAEGWETLGGSPERNAARTNVQPSGSWTAEFAGDAPGVLSFIALGSYVVVLLNPDLQAISLTDGTPAWRAAGVYDLDLAGAEGLIFAGSEGIAAIDAGSGQRVWEWQDNRRHLSIAVNDGQVYLATHQGSVRALSNGSVSWETDVGMGVAQSPTLADGLLIVAGADVDGTLMALDGSTGSVAWRQTLGRALNTMPAAAQDRIYVASSDRAWAVSRETGDLLWEVGLPEIVIGAPVVRGQSVFLAWPSGVIALDAATGEVLWQRKLGVLASWPLPPVYASARLYSVYANTIVEIDPESGRVLRKRSYDGRIVALPIVVGDFVIVGTERWTPEGLRLSLHADPLSSFRPALPIPAPSLPPLLAAVLLAGCCVGRSRGRREAGE